MAIAIHMGDINVSANGEFMAFNGGVLYFDKKQGCDFEERAGTRVRV